MTIKPGKIVVRDDLSPVPWLGEEGRFLLRSEDTGGAFSFFEVTTSPSGGPPLHLHDDHDEALFVIEGEYEIRVDEQTVKGLPGTLAYTPRGTAHRFRNVIDTPSKLLIIASPGGHERFFEELSAVILSGPPDPAKFAAVASKHHITGLEPFVPAGGPRPGGPAGPFGGAPNGGAPNGGAPNGGRQPGA